MRRAEGVERSGPGRREFIILGVGALAVAAIPFVRYRRTLVRRAIPVMGTVGEIVVVHGDRHYAQQAIDASFARLRMVEQTMTRFTSTSDVGRANRLAAREAVPITRETATVLREALRWADATDGAFDPCLGKVVALWDVGRRNEPPKSEEVRPLAGRRLYRALDLDTWNGRPAVRFGDPDVAIDLGGIGKGYGVDEAVRVLRDWGIAHALVNVGGDLYAIGKSLNGDPWRIGIRSPDRPDRMVETVDVQDAAIATSGDYLQYFEHAGRRYHHLLDPDTAAPRRTRMRSLTVRAADCMTADAAATAAYSGAHDLRPSAQHHSPTVIHAIYS